MNAYAVAHLGFAALCALMALAHGFLFVLDRSERVHRWAALVFACFAAFNVAVGGSSEASQGAFGPGAPWLVLAVLSASGIWIGCFQMGWSLLGDEAPRASWRRALVAAAAGEGVVRAMTVAYAAGQASAAGLPPPTWEGAFNRLDALTVLSWVLNVASGVAMYLGAMRDFRRHAVPRVLYPLVVISSLPSAALLGRELLLVTGRLEGPTLLGPNAVSLAFFSAVMLGARSARAKTSAVERIGEYRLLRKLGEGGMGELYLASRVGPAGFERQVALKRMLSRGAGDPRGVERFLAEARLAARLDHPNIVAVYDLGQLPDGWFIAMEYLTGASLRELSRRSWARGQPLRPEVVLSIAESVCRGLSHAHAAGVVHRDVSPHNVMVTLEGGVKLVDFGVAKERGAQDAPVTRPPTPSPTPELTAPGAVVGKGPYLSPEQLRGLPPAPSMDLFALGVTVYELLAGARPFGGDEAKMAADVLAGRYPPLRERRPEVPPEVEAVVARALVPEPEGRFPDAEAMRKEIAACLSRLPAPDLAGTVRELLQGRMG